MGPGINPNKPFPESISGETLTSQSTLSMLSRCTLACQKSQVSNEKRGCPGWLGLYRGYILPSLNGKSFMKHYKHPTRIQWTVGPCAFFLRCSGLDMLFGFLKRVIGFVRVVIPPKFPLSSLWNPSGSGPPPPWTVPPLRTLQQGVGQGLNPWEL